jgi:hypothetical protein
MAKATLNNKKTLFIRKLDISLRKKLVKWYIWGRALYGAENWTLWKVDPKCLYIFETWCWRRLQKISWTDHVRNEEVLHTVKKERNILPTIKRRKANWIGHILRRNCLLKHVVEGMIKGKTEVMGRRGRTRKQQLDDLKETRILKLKEEALDRTLWRTRFGRGSGPVLRRTAE